MYIDTYYLSYHICGECFFFFQANARNDDDVMTHSTRKPNIFLTRGSLKKECSLPKEAFHSDKGDPFTEFLFPCVAFHSYELMISFVFPPPFECTTVHNFSLDLSDVGYFCIRRKM